MKRIEIASVLAKEHSLCIFDEPEAGIDLWSFSMLIQKFEEIHTEKKQSLIVISHQEKIINMADRIMIIDGGVIDVELCDILSVKYNLSAVRCLNTYQGLCQSGFSTSVWSGDDKHFSVLYLK